MKRTFIINGRTVEMTETTAFFDGSEIDVIIMHDADDEFNEGDCITADYAGYPDNDEEAAYIAENAYWVDEWHVDDNGMMIL